MEVLAAIFVIAFGLAFGSFLNVCITRLPLHQSIVQPSSRCPLCQAPIAARDNIPLLSFLLLRGRCRSCRQPISWRYPAIELTNAALWLLCWLRFDLSLRAAGMAVFAFIMLGLAAMDAETFRLPNTFTLPGIALGIIFSGVTCTHWFKCALLSASWAVTVAGLLLATSGLYWLLRRREGIGIGDAKLMALIAAWLGPSQAVLVFVMGIVATALCAVAIILRRRRFDGSIPLPLGAFLCAASLFAMFYGQNVVYWYLSFYR
ncbi:MAG TPA: prepilin peptidase [Acidobacteriaceae bacterium]|nr:prepilin peptidase [Acidobacteriaceae bacterium]